MKTCAYWSPRQEIDFAHTYAPSTVTLPPSHLLAFNLPTFYSSSAPSALGDAVAPSVRSVNSSRDSPSITDS